MPGVLKNIHHDLKHIIMLLLVQYVCKDVLYYGDNSYNFLTNLHLTKIWSQNHVINQIQNLNNVVSSYSLILMHVHEVFQQQSLILLHSNHPPEEIWCMVTFNEINI